MPYSANMVFTQSLALLFLVAFAAPNCMASSDVSCKNNLGDSNHDLDEVGALQLHRNSETISERDVAKSTRALEAEAVKDGDYTFLVPCDHEERKQALVWPDQEDWSENTNTELKWGSDWAEMGRAHTKGPIWQQAGSRIIPRLIPCKDQENCGEEPLSEIPCKGSHLERFESCGEGGRKGSPLRWDMSLALQNGYTLHNGELDPHAYFLYSCWGLDKHYYWSRWGKYDRWVVNGSLHERWSYPVANQVKFKVKSYDGVMANNSTVSYGDKIVIYNPAYNDNELSRTKAFNPPRAFCGRKGGRGVCCAGWPACEFASYVYWYSPNYKGEYEKENTCWKFVKAPPLQAPP